MIAKRLEAILAKEAAKIDLPQRSPADMVQRFQSLRGFGLLPKGRGKNAQPLSPSEIVAGILSIVTEKPGYAGLASKVLSDLRPVGGIKASFRECSTLSEAIAVLLTDLGALTSLIEIRISSSEIYKNGHGRAAIEYRSGDTIKTSYYVGKLAVSLLQSGAERAFDPGDLISSIVAETVFYPSLFRRLSRELQIKPPELDVLTGNDLEEDDEEKQREERAQRLGLTPNSRFLNFAVDTQVTWPHKETVVSFEGHKLILLPKTRENTTSIHIDLHAQKLTVEDAQTLFNRFLSALTWCDDQFAILQEGWAGNPAPIAVPKRNLGFSTAHYWIFDRKIPKSDKAKKAIAIYRDARNAQQNHLISYAVLSYYKIIEVKYKKTKAINWFRENYETLRKNPNLAEDISRFETERGTKKPHNYLWESCRCAVAHANEPFSTDPDDLHELRRLHIAADILRALARLFIQNELRVSDCSYDGS